MSRAYDSITALLQCSKSTSIFEGQEKYGLIDDLQFLQKQSMSDEDKRASDEVCREVWKRAEPKLLKLKIKEFEKHQSILRDFFNIKFKTASLDFNEFKNEFSTPLKNTDDFPQSKKGFKPTHLGMGYSESARPLSPEKIRELDKMEPLPFFEDVQWRIKKLEIKNQTEKAILLLAIGYLVIEASRGKPLRNQATIVIAWKLLKPRLDKLGVLEYFKPARTLSSRIKLFIFGRY